MILLDPDLDPYPAPQAKPAKSLAPPGLSTRSLAPFLRKAQAAIRLRGLVSVLLTTDAAIRKLNRQYRGKNKATDVLSFPALDLYAVSRSRPRTGALKVAGDLAISIDTARKQAAEQGHTLNCELKILMLHGLLHLAGYDHEADDGEMARREARLRAKFGLPQGLIERASRREASTLAQGGAQRNPGKAPASGARRPVGPARKPGRRSPKP